MGYLRDLLMPGMSVTSLPAGDIQNPSLWLLNATGERSTSGEVVSEERSLGLAAYFAAIRNIGQDVAKLPRQLRRHRKPRGSERVTGLEHASARLLRRPNPVMSWQVFAQCLQFRACGAGNGYAEIVRNQLDEPVELWPVHPSRLKPRLAPGGKRKVYDWTPDGVVVKKTLEEREVLHVQGVGSGIEGISMLRAGAEVLGLGLAAQRHAAAFYSEGMAKRMVAIVKEKMGAAGRKGLRERIVGDQALDPVGRRKLPILEGDVTLSDVGIPPEEAQFLESREFTVEEVARLVRIGLSKLQFDRKAKGWGTQELEQTSHVIDTLMPWITTWEGELDAKLLTEEEQAAEELYFKIVIQGLMRGDSAARTAYYNGGLQNGWLSPNDVRELEDLQPIDDPAADEYRTQAQNRPIGEGAGQPAAPAAPREDPRPGLPEPDDDQGGAPAGERAGAMLAALDPVFQDAALRVTHKEANALQRALRQHVGNAAALAAWAAPFYARMAEEAAEALVPACTAAGLAGAAPVLRQAVGAWMAATDWPAYCRNVAGGDVAQRARALAGLAIDLCRPTGARP